MLRLHELACERDGRLLFCDLNLAVSAGDIVQIQGPNGSGKTTLLRVLTGVSADYQGRIEWRGEAMPTARLDYHRNLLYIGHQPAVKRSLTPEENLAWYCGLAGEQKREQIEAALAAVDLVGYEDVPSYRLSAGQLRRVALARLYLSRAPVWILDEPFTAIDYQGVDKLRAQFGRHAAAGGILIVTTHQDLGIEGVRLVNLQEYAGRD